MTGTSDLGHQMSTDLPCLTLGRRAGTKEDERICPRRG